MIFVYKRIGGFKAVRAILIYVSLSRINWVE